MGSYSQEDYCSKFSKRLVVWFPRYSAYKMGSGRRERGKVLADRGNIALPHFAHLVNGTWE